MTIDATTATAPTAATAAATKTTTAGARATGGLDRDAFLKLLVAQMRYQDPGKPMDSTAFVGQSAQFTTLEVLQQLQASTAAALSFQGVLLSSALVGKQVTVAGADGSPVTGKVESARNVAGNAFVVVNGETYPVSRVYEVR